jgi:hypothetical protein
MTLPDYRTTNYGMSYYVVEPKNQVRQTQFPTATLESLETGAKYGIGQPIPRGWYLAHMPFSEEKK